MTRPTTSDPKLMTTPIQNRIQFGVGIRATPPIVMPTRATRTAVQAAGDDPCMRTPYPASLSDRGVLALILRTPEIGVVGRLDHHRHLALIARRHPRPRTPTGRDDDAQRRRDG